MDAESKVSAAASATYPLRLYKKEKLCSVIAIGQLFGASGGGDTDFYSPRAALVYPLRLVWRLSPGRKSDAPVQFLISVPKKRLRHAVDRVQMRRRIREAYRLRRAALMLPAGARVDVVFIYVGKGPEPYAKVDRAMERLLRKLGAEVQEAVTKTAGAAVTETRTETGACADNNDSLNL